MILSFELACSVKRNVLRSRLRESILLNVKKKIQISRLVTAQTFGTNLFNLEKMPPPKKVPRFSEGVKNRPMTEIHEPDLSSLLESPTESFERSRNKGDLQISGIPSRIF